MERDHIGTNKNFTGKTLSNMHSIPRFAVALAINMQIGRVLMG